MEITMWQRGEMDRPAAFSRPWAPAFADRPPITFTISRSTHRLTLIEGGRQRKARKVVGGNVPLDETAYHLEIVSVDVHKTDLAFLKLGHGEQVADELPREADAPRADKGELHGYPPSA